MTDATGRGELNRLITLALGRIEDLEAKGVGESYVRVHRDDLERVEDVADVAMHSLSIARKHVALREIAASIKGWLSGTDET